jgi:hypothetical protein
VVQRFQIEWGAGGAVQPDVGAVTSAKPIPSGTITSSDVVSSSVAAGRAKRILFFVTVLSLGVITRGRRFKSGHEGIGRSPPFGNQSSNKKIRRDVTAA